jgi:hypothetical protein
MSFNIIPCEGLGLIGIGDSRAEIRARLGDPVTFRRTQWGAPIDHYPDLGLMLSFDASGGLDFIELAEPAEVFFNGVALLNRSYRGVIAELGRNGIVGVEDDFGVEFRDLCFSLFTQMPGEDGSRVEGVSVFAPEYYK